VTRAAFRAVFRSEEFFDLLVGSVDGSGFASFFLALAAELQSRFDKVVGLRRFRFGCFGV